MALLTSYGNSNKKTDTLLAVRYSVEYTDGFYRTTRKASKVYSYIGMTRDAAEECRDAKIAQYTRTYINIDSANPRTEVIGSVSYQLPGIYEFTDCGAECVARHDHDGSWMVDITVNESDVIMSVEPANDPASLFEQWTMLRNYDETYKDSIFNLLSAIAVTSPNYTTLNLSWLPEYFGGADSLSDFTDLHVYYKATASTVSWTEVAVGSLTVGQNDITIDGISSVGYFWQVKSGDFATPVKVSTELINVQ